MLSEVFTLEGVEEFGKIWNHPTQGGFECMGFLKS